MTDDGTAEQAINGPSSPASSFQIARAAKIPGCTATRISSRFLLTALHCNEQKGSFVQFYTNGTNENPTTLATITRVITRPGTNALDCQNSTLSTAGCWDSNGRFADMAILQLSVDIPTGAPATLAWAYPGDNHTGTKVGAGGHDGQPNPTAKLLQVDDQTDGDDSDGSFLTVNSRVDGGDSGGPFYYQSRVLGTLFGETWVAGEASYDGLHTSVPKHLDWILTSIGYTWSGSPPQAGIQYAGTPVEPSFTQSERGCQYACEQTASCEAYNFYTPLSICTLETHVTGTSPNSTMHAALHYGQSGGKSNDVVGYVRSDGYNSVLHVATNGHIHEIYANGSGWSVGDISNNNPPAVASKLSAYRRADGINAVVYRASGGQVIEIALGAQGWDWADLTSWGGALAAGDPVGYVRADGISAVVFRSANGHINELRLGTAGWIPQDLTSASLVPVTASSDPATYVRSDGLSSVVFRSGTQIWELFKAPGQAWDWGEPSALATPAPAAAASKPFGYTHHDGTNAIVYRTTTGGITELWLDGNGWHSGALPTGRAVFAGGNPTAYVRTDAIESVVFRSTTNQIMEIANNPWAAWNLTSYGQPNATTDPVPYIRTDGYNAVLEGLPANHAGELAYKIGSPWWPGDLTISSSESP